MLVFSPFLSYIFPFPYQSSRQSYSIVRVMVKQTEQLRLKPFENLVLWEFCTINSIHIHPFPQLLPDPHPSISYNLLSSSISLLYPNESSPVCAAFKLIVVWLLPELLRSTSSKIFKKSTLHFQQISVANVTMLWEGFHV